MCLKRVDLNLEWEKGVKDYVGYGFKKICASAVFKNYKETGEFEVREHFKFNEWLKAVGSQSLSSTLLSQEKIQADDGKKYHPGFHIFLNEEDAKNYTRYGLVVPVAFTGVVSFGRNETRFGGDGPCVIAKYMYIYEPMYFDGYDLNVHKVKLTGPNKFKLVKER